MVPFYPTWNFRFNTNSEWKCSTGSIVKIVHVHAYDDNPEGISDYCVVYQDSQGNTYQKDAWNFQVRYTHVSDAVVRSK